MSSVATVPVISYPWPTDVLDFAAKQQVGQYLEPLMEATRRLFPTAEIKVVFERVRELRDVEWIAFEVRVPKADFPDLLATERKWDESLLRICPASFSGNFVLTLYRTA